jgi:hypothetical protein
MQLMNKSGHKKEQQASLEVVTGHNTVAPIDGFRKPNRKGHEESAVINLDSAPLVDPGVYRLTFIHYRTALVYGRAPKVALRFRIVDNGPFFEIELDRWYNCKRLIGKPCKSGRFEIGRQSDFLREYLTIFPNAMSRRDRISFKPYRKNLITGRVETVIHNAKQQPLPELMQYSIIRELLEVGA